MTPKETSPQPAPSTLLDLIVHSTRHLAASARKLKTAKAAVVCLLPLPVLTMAQPAPVAAAKASAPEEVVELSPFSVTATEGTGYRVKDTMAGTRLRSDVGDVGASITEISKDFINDLGISNVMDLANFLPSTERETSQVALTDGSGPFRAQRFQIRGIFTESIGRNFFTSAVGEYMPPSDGFNTDRITLSAGANSILFGSANPAGIINFQTEPASLYKDNSRLLHRLDNYGTFRAEYAVNKVLIKNKLAFRINLLDEELTGYRKPQYLDQKRLYAAIQWKPFRNTTINANIERANYHRNQPFPALLISRINKWDAFGQPTTPYSPTVGPGTVSPGLASASGANVAGVVLDSGSPTSLNFKNFAIGSSFTQGVTNHSNMAVPFGFIDDSLNVGNARIDKRKFWIGDISVEQKLADNLYAQVAYFESHHQKYIGTTGGSSVFVDANTTLPSGAPNPDVGKYFTLGGANLQDFLYTNNTLRGTLTYNLDLTKFNRFTGRHMIAGMVERDDGIRYTDASRLQNVTPFSGFSSSIVDATNAITPRYYFDPKKGNFSPGAAYDLLNYERYFSQIPGITAKYLPIRAGTDTRALQDVYMGAAQSFWFNDRLVTTVGYRIDTQDVWDVTPAAWLKNPDGSWVSWRTGRLPRIKNPVSSGVREPTHSYGAVLHVVKNLGSLDALSLTYNTSTNFSPSDAVLNFQQNIIPNASGKTKDYGINLSLFHGKLDLKVSQFKSGQTNARSFPAALSTMLLDYNAIWNAIAVTNPSYSSRVAFVNADTQDVDAKGVEFSATYNPTRNWRISLMGSKNNTVLSNIAPSAFKYVADNRATALQFANVLVTGSATSGVVPVSTVIANDDITMSVLQAQNGFASSELRKWKFSGVSNYDFTQGMLKGINFGGYISWMSPSIIGYPSLDAVGKVPDIANPFMGAVVFDTGLTLGYHRKIYHDRMIWKIQLNVRNLLDDHKPTPIRADELANSNNVQQNYAWRIVEPRSFIVTNTLTW
jgi:outer membrane receptor protein involved in Fe transport